MYISITALCVSIGCFLGCLFVAVIKCISSNLHSTRNDMLTKELKSLGDALEQRSREAHGAKIDFANASRNSENFQRRNEALHQAVRKLESDMAAMKRDHDVAVYENSEWKLVAEAREKFIFQLLEERKGKATCDTKS